MGGAACSLGGPILWPAAEAPAGGRCAACGAPRVFELQAMPALHQSLSEGLAWQQQSEQPPEHGSAGGPAVAPSIDAWSWLTMAVFSCSASCDGGSSGPHLVEEAVQILNE